MCAPHRVASSLFCLSPPEQQTRYVHDGDELTNRIRIEVNQGGPPPFSTPVPGDPHVNWGDIRTIQFERDGSPDLINIAPVEHHLIYFVVSDLVVQYGCKGELLALYQPVATR